MTGIFCEVFGDSVRNRIIENLLIYTYTGISIPDLAKESEISKQRAYQIVEEFEKKGYIKKYREIRKTQLWVLNENNPTVKIWELSLKECMKIISNEYKEKHSETNQKARIEAK